MSKTILLLGGSMQQLDSFQAAQQLGYRTVLCDWDAECPGRELADVFHEVSTLDREAVLEVAQAECVDGIVSYASDAPAPVAAWVSEKLGLPGNPSKSVEMLCDKGKFRAFLSNNGFAVPNSAVVHGCSLETDAAAICKMELPLVIKPVDSAGSRGVSIVRNPEEINAALVYAREFSRKDEMVVERYVESASPGRVIEAEIFVEDGVVVSWGLMSAYRDLSLNGLVPSSYIHPLDECRMMESSVRETISTLVSRAGIVQGAMNIELIADHSGNIYLIDVGPRNGGNYLPSFFSHISGDDIVKATLRVAVGESSGLSVFNRANNGMWVQFMHYSHIGGVFQGFLTTQEYDSACIETHLYKEVGSRIDPLVCIGDSIGVSLLHFPKETNAEDLVSRLPDMCRTIVD